MGKDVLRVSNSSSSLFANALTYLAKLKFMEAFIKEAEEELENELL